MNRSPIAFQPTSRPTNRRPSRSSTVTTSARWTPHSFTRKSPGSVGSGSHAWVHAQPDRPAGRAPADALDLRDQVDVEMDVRMDEDLVEIPLRQVCARVADLVLSPSELECPSDLPRRADVHAD